VVPLVVFTASKVKLGELVAPRWLTLIAVLIATLLISLNVKLIFDFLTGAL
jgi:manganese transport protein